MYEVFFIWNRCHRPSHILVNQGKIAIKYWSGKEVSAQVMRQSLLDLFS